MRRISAAGATQPNDRQLLSLLYLCTQGRSIITSPTFTPGPGDRGERVRQIASFRKLRGGAAYHIGRKAWPSVERRERHMTAHAFPSAMGREELNLLPLPDGRGLVNELVAEGSGSRHLLETVQAEIQQRRRNNRTALAYADDEPSTVVPPPLAEESIQQDQLPSSSESIHDKTLLGPQDLAGTSLASFSNAKAVLLEELLGDRKGMADTTGQALWDAVPGMSPLMAKVAAEKIGPTATRVQHRLLSALLHENHNDVLLSSPTGSGRTWSLVLAALNGVHTEDKGVNILVAGSATAAMRMHSMVMTLCGHYGGSVAGRKVDDMESWIQVGCHVEDAHKYYEHIMDSVYNPEGPKRLMILTTNVLAELFFQHMLQFESLGYLRRVYLDDVGQQLQMLRPDASVAMVRERLASPRSIEMLLATLHQLPGPHIRALFQLGLVGNDIDTATKKHIDDLCLKPAAKTILLTPTRIPTSLHVTYSFFSTFGQRRDEAVDFDPALVYTKEYIYNARNTIPGRAVIFVPNTADLYQCRSQLRRMGMDVKVLSEVRGSELLPNGEVEWKQGWKFLILREQDAIGLSLPLVSHCFVTFAPPSRHSLASMVSIAAQVGSVGWATVLCNQSLAPHVRVVATELDLPFIDRVLTKELALVPSQTADRISRAPAPLGMDPQSILKSHYLVQTDLAAGSVFDREFFGNDSRMAKDKEMHHIDYEPLFYKMRRHTNARKLDHDMSVNPQLALDLQKRELLDNSFRPTKKLTKAMTYIPSTKSGMNIYKPYTKGSREQR